MADVDWEGELERERDDLIESIISEIRGRLAKHPDKTVWRDLGRALVCEVIDSRDYPHAGDVRDLVGGVNSALARRGSAFRLIAVEASFPDSVEYS
jgi:hypothetical protein